MRFNALHDAKDMRLLRFSERWHIQSGCLVGNCVRQAIQSLDCPENHGVILHLASPQLPERTMRYWLSCLDTGETDTVRRHHRMAFLFSLSAYAFSIASGRSFWMIARGLPLGSVNCGRSRSAGRWSSFKSA